MNAFLQTQDKLKTIVEQMCDVPVLVIGDIMLDRFIYGSVDRISPESPVPVLNVSREDKMLGGAGNALSSLAGMKMKGHIISVVGDDADAQILKEEIRAIGVDPDCLVVDGNRPTIVKTRFLAGHQQLLRSDFESKQAIEENVRSQVLNKARTLIPSMKAVLISDYGKGLLGRDLLQDIISVAKENNVPVIVDPKGKDFSIYEGATAITPNKKELSEALENAPVDNDQQVIDAASRIISECGIKSVIVTRSQDGMSIIQQGQEIESLHLRTIALEVFDVSGAGDVVIATITAALASGATMEEAGTLANVAGGIAVSKVGTTPIRSKELIHALEQEETQSHIRPASEVSSVDRTRSAPVCDFDEAREQVQRWRSKGLKVGFTNGCFDILHLGHVSYLNEARESCDRLVIGLNTDLSVKALKGPERPIHGQEGRSKVLAALGSVDMVVFFGSDSADDDQTANQLLSLLQPDIYFKGGDYEVNEIPETPTVRSYGGDVKVLSAFAGHSTTFSIEKMKNKAA